MKWLMRIALIPGTALGVQDAGLIGFGYLLGLGLGLGNDTSIALSLAKGTGHVRSSN